MNPLPTIAITLGDPAGVGPEVIAKALSDPALPKSFRFEVIGLDAAQKAGITHGTKHYRIRPTGLERSQ